QNSTTINANTTNTAEVIGFHQLGNVTDDASAFVRVINPDISLTKEVEPEKVLSGTEVTYTFNATNTGDVTLDNVEITDDQLGHIAGPVSLAPGESLVSENSTTITANTTNTAEVIGFHQLGNVTDDASAFVRVINPDISLTKEADVEKVVGETEVTYTFNATNTGDVTLDNVTITDDQLGHIAGPVSLAPGASLVSQNSTTINANTTNTAEVIGFHQLGNVTDDASVTIRQLSLGIELTKTVDEEKILSGAEVTYTFNATNTGTVTLNDVEITDDQLGHIAGPVSLAPGESLVVQNSTTINANTTNTAEVIGFFQLGNVTDQDSAFVRVINPDIQLTKSVDQEKLLNGTEVTYTFNATNTGDTTLDNVTI
ncbi:MAG: DUF7507 domain-containing protein, partial [Nitrososphaera sp.]